MATKVITDAQAKKNIAANITELLKERGLSQSELARATGEPRMTICRVSNGKHMPGAALLARISEALQVPIDYLVNHRGKKSQKSA